MKKISLKRDNRGASLLAVLILMVVVSAIAVVITKITIVNIQMKEVERGTKKISTVQMQLWMICVPVQENLQKIARESIYGCP